MIKKIEEVLGNVLLLTAETDTDNRATKCICFSKKNLEKLGIHDSFSLEYTYDIPKTGTLYGIHYQNNPYAQGKLFYCLAGKGIDFAIDLRKTSPTYKKWISFELSKDNHNLIYIPEGFGHCFLSLEDNTLLSMKLTNSFIRNYSMQLKYDDPEINLEFPIDIQVVAEKDLNAPLLKDAVIDL